MASRSDSGIGLPSSLTTTRAAFPDVEQASERRDDTVGQGVIESERIADCEYALSHQQITTGPYRYRRRSVKGHADTKYRQQG